MAHSTAFAERVYRALLTVPRGRVVTYAALAQMIGAPKAARAVGTALRKNPTLVTVPCHRVVRASGDVGQYAGGVAQKISLLKKEGVTVENGRVDMTQFLLVNPV